MLTEDNVQNQRLVVGDQTSSKFTLLRSALWSDRDRPLVHVSGNRGSALERLKCEANFLMSF